MLSPHSGGQSTNNGGASKAIEQLLFLRNRAAHHEPIYRRDLRADLERAIALLACIDATAATWASQRESLSAVLQRKPA